MRKAIFLDKDGTLIKDVPYNVNPDLIRFTDGAIDGLRKLKDRGYMLIVVSNQSGIARGYFGEADLRHLERRLTEMLTDAGVLLDGFFFCPHHPDGLVNGYSVACECRKPAPGMIFQAADAYDIDLRQSWMIGDILNDIEAGNTAGCKTILIDNGNETEWMLSDKRKPTATATNLREAAEIITKEFQPA